MVRERAAMDQDMQLNYYINRQSRDVFLRSRTVVRSQCNDSKSFVKNITSAADLSKMLF